MHNQTCSKSAFNISVLFIDIDNVCIVIPTNDITLVTGTDILNKESVLLEPDFRGIRRHGIAGQMRCPAKKNR